MESQSLTGDVLRVGATIVVPDRGELPRRCIKCNAPASGDPIRYTFVDSDVGGAPRGVISAFVHFRSRRTGRVTLHMCDRHRRLRTLIRWGCPVEFLVALAIGIYANVAYPKPPELLVDITVFLTIASLLPLGIYQMHYLKGRVRDGQVWVDGAGWRFWNLFRRNSPSHDPWTRDP